MAGDESLNEWFKMSQSFMAYQSSAYCFKELESAGKHPEKFSSFKVW